MAVVTRLTNGYPNATPTAGFASQSGNSLESRANRRGITFNIAAANGDSAASIYRLGRVPSNVILRPESLLYCPAIAGATSVSLGLDDNGGHKAPACLMSAVNISAGGSFAMLSAVAVANYNQRAWQLIGGTLTQDPNTLLDVYLTLNNALAAAGAIAGWLDYMAIGV